MKTCTKCNIEKLLEDFYKSSKSKDGRKSSCKECHKKDNNLREPLYKAQRAKYRKENREKLLEAKRLDFKNNKDKRLIKNKEWSKSLAGRLYSYKKSANKRNINWELTDDEFATFWNKNCKYCGLAINGIGIDRVTNNEGYNLNNCVSCCTKCNYMKTNYSENDFFEHIKLIYKNINKNERD